MTSVSPEEKKSAAQHDLDLVLGKRNVKLNGLTPAEFYEFLRQALENIDLHELRGFRPLKEELTARGRDPTPNQMDLGRVEMAEGVTVSSEGFEEPITLDSHVLCVTRGVITQNLVWKVFETGVESDDYRVTMEWPRGSGYLHRGKREFLYLRRTKKDNYASQNLVHVAFSFVKVVGEACHRVTDVSAVHVSLDRFMKHFGHKYAEVAKGLIGELWTAHGRTVSALESQLDRFRKTTGRFERMVDSTSAD
jgi:hypothetical protein